jgi:hypothetical protein
MPYTAEISRTNPACFVFLVDQSKSMAEPFSGQHDTQKSVVVADAINRLVQNLVLRSAKADGVRDYFHVAVIGYGKTVRAELGAADPNDALVPISQLGSKPLRVERRVKLVSDGAGGSAEQEVKFPVWYDPVANGPTPMCGALAAALVTAARFTDKYKSSYPPIVLNITDGMPTDGDPQPDAKRIRQLKTADGNALLFNLLISSDPKPPVYFLSDGTLLVDLYSRLLFAMSSVLPPRLQHAARAEGFRVEEKSRGVVYNADPVAVVRFLDIGTRVAVTR